MRFRTRHSSWDFCSTATSVNYTTFLSPSFSEGKARGTYATHFPFFFQHCSFFLVFLLLCFLHMKISLPFPKWLSLSLFPFQQFSPQSFCTLRFNSAYSSLSPPKTKQHPSNCQAFPSVQRGEDGRRGALAGEWGLCYLEAIATLASLLFHLTENQHILQYLDTPFFLSLLSQSTQNFMLFLLSPH